MTEDLYIIVTLPNGERRTLPALEGWTVMEILRDAGMPIKAECGGACACATCHVYIDPAWYPKLTPQHDEEKDMLADFAMDPKENSRLSCQILMTPALDGLELTVAPNPD